MLVNRRSPSVNAGATGTSNRDDLDRLRADVTHVLEQLGDTSSLEAIVGIPFYDEDDTIAGIVDSARAGLERIHLTDRSVILCVAPHEHEAQLKRALKHRSRNRIPTRAFGHHHGLEGHGWALRTIIDVAAGCGSALVILRPNLDRQDGDGRGRGLSPSWIEDLLRPVHEFGQGLALASFTRHVLAHPVDSLLAYPVMAEVFGLRLRQPTPGVMALSPKLVQTCAASSSTWPRDCGVYGFDTWIVTRALRAGQPVCEVPLGLPSFRYEARRLKLAFRQVAHTLLQEVVEHADWWLEEPDVMGMPSRVKGLDVEVAPPTVDLDPSGLFRRFKKEFDHFDDTLFGELLPDDLRRRLERLSDRGENGVSLDAKEWRDVVNRFLIAFRFETSFHPDDIVDGLFPLFLARLSGFIEEMRAIEAVVPDAARSRKRATKEVLRQHAEHLVERETDLFIAERGELRHRWQQRALEIAPYLPRLGAWEFVPHVGVVVPQELQKPNGGFVSAGDVYKDILDRYRREFMQFLEEHLDLREVTDSATILERVHGFMMDLERTLEAVLPYDLTTVNGVREMTEFVYGHFGKRDVFQLTPDAARHILTQTPPNELIMHLRCRNVGALLSAHEAGDAFAMAAWTERPAFLEKVLHTIEESADATWFHTEPLKPVVVRVEFLADPTEMRGIRALARLAGRLIAGNLQKGWGGEYPTLWYLLQLVHDIVATESYAELWEQFQNDRVDFSQRVVNSIRGHWGRQVMSAHHLFKNRHQRITVERLQQFAKRLAQSGGKSARAAALLQAAARVYNLSITLPDSRFVPLSAWTWTSYSYRGGLGTPTPLSSLVERDWATADFLTEYLTRTQLGNESTIYRKVVERIAEGREFEDISGELLKVPARETQSLIITQTPAARSLFARKLLRPVERPILEPVEGHDWENRYVLNAGAVRIDGNVYILYRAFGTDKVSRIGLAWTRDGVNIEGRLDHPVFEPGDVSESHGVEDPRVAIIEGRIYVLYTAFDGEVAQIAMASIKVDDFVEHRFDQWKRHGLGFPGLANKDAVLYPETFDGRYVIYHRLDPNMWVSHLDDLTCPWPRTGQKIVAGPRPGMMWDGVKIGAGAQPIKTTEGWLNIYHGVDYERCYRLGVLFMALDDPTRVIYRSPNAILEPEFDFEVGRVEGRDYWVPKVVFTCGAVPATDKDIVEPEDEILVYYGAADTAIGVAKGRLCDMVPTLLPRAR